MPPPRRSRMRRLWVLLMVLLMVLAVVSAVLHGLIYLLCAGLSASGDATRGGSGCLNASQSGMWQSLYVLGAAALGCSATLLLRHLPGYGRDTPERPPSYAWRCLVCQHLNPAGTGHCAACHHAASLSSRDIEQAQAALPPTEPQEPGPDASS